MVFKEPGKDIQVFATELSAKESLGYKEPMKKNVVNAKSVTAILVSVKMMNKAEVIARDKIAADFTAKWEYRLDKNSTEVQMLGLLFAKKTKRVSL